MNKVGNNIRKIRLLFDIKQETMAKMIGISVNSYGKIERNEVLVSQERLIQIAGALGVEPAYIMNFNEVVATMKISSNTQS